MAGGFGKLRRSAGLEFTGIRLLVLATACLTAHAQTQGEAVQFVRGNRTVPTYTFGRAETVAPLFESLEDMGHYPYTKMDWDSRSHKPVPVEYESLVIENQFLRVEFLPELGGRIWSARDKLAGRELFYHPTVIKPARYNQRGAWPVGNLELYGPFDAHMLTYPGEPWPWALRRHTDGAVSIILSHVDHFFRNKISLEVTLRPGRSFLETTIRLHNRNLVSNRYLLWTNAGVAVTEGSRFVYPMTRTIGHDSSALGTWPMINGVDLSWNRNNKNMLGVFGLDIHDDFMSIYDYKVDYGTVCYTNRMLARGMKTWTFGAGQTALRHMANYTDNDGLYMETQSGRFIWDGNYEIIEPGKTDGWTEFWFGAGGLGGLTSATRDVALHWEIPPKGGGESIIALTPTGAFPQAQLEIRAGDRSVWSARRDLAVGKTVREKLELNAAGPAVPLALTVRSRAGRLLMDYIVHPGNAHPNAEYAADSIPRNWGPVDRLSAEECYQKGLGHEKFGQIQEAEAAYAQALTKDVGYSQAHLRLGMLAMDRFDSAAAEERFLKVLERDPTNGDAHYYLALIHAERGELLEARRHAYRLLPSAEKFHRRDYLLGLFALKSGEIDEARDKFRAAMHAASHDVSVRQAWGYVLRLGGRAKEAAAESSAILDIDPTNAFARAEELHGTGTGADPDAEGLFHRACAHHPQGYLELATEYIRLSAWTEAAWVLERGIGEAAKQKSQPDPLLLYHRAWVARMQNKPDAMGRFLEAARRHPLELEIYPFRSEDVPVLTFALDENERDANAATLLAILLYSRGRREEAVDLWTRALKAEPAHFPALRNLGLAQVVDGLQTEGLNLLTQAARVNPRHVATVLLVANLNARLGRPEAAREVFQQALSAAPGNDILIERLAGVESQLGNNPRAMQLLDSHTFQPTHQSYALLHLYRALRLGLASESAAKGDFEGALKDMASAERPSANLGVDDFATVASSRLLVFEALLHEARGDSASASRAWREAASTRDDDIEGEGLFRALALHKTGESGKAAEWFREFERVNEMRKKDNSLDVRTHAFSMAGFYSLFSGEDKAAEENFRRSVEMNQSYAYGRQALTWLNAGLLKGLRR